MLPGATNVTVEIIIKLHQEGKSLPKVLYVQLDNTVKNNKSKYVISYLYLLVCIGVFDKVQTFFWAHTVARIRFFQGTPYIWLTRLFLALTNFVTISKDLAQSLSMLAIEIHSQLAQQG